MGSSSHSRNKSKPTLLPEQKQIWDYMGSQIIPQSMGKETFLTQLQGQRARDEGAMLQQQGMQGIQTQAAQSEMGPAEVATLMKQLNDKALSESFKRITEQRQQTALNALQMISGLPIQPSQQEKSTSKGWSAIA
jgi:hypothetical protein